MLDNGKGLMFMPGEEWRRERKMKVRYTKEMTSISLTKNKVYDVLSIEKGWYRILDDTEEDYLYPPDVFEIVED